MAVLVGTTCLHRTNNTTFTLQNPLFLFSVPSNPLHLSCPYLPNPNFYSQLCLRRRLSPPLPSHPGRCLVAKAGRPSSESDPKTEPPRLAGSEGSMSRFQDRIQIFFAVLFWMSLFFWTCAWDDKNRPNKGSRFRR